MQDGPFLSVRLCTIIHYNIITHSIVFFVATNAIAILLHVYKICLLLNKLCCRKKHSSLSSDNLEKQNAVLKQPEQAKNKQDKLDAESVYDRQRTICCYENNSCQDDDLKNSILYKKVTSEKQSAKNIKISSTSDSRKRITLLISVKKQILNVFF